MIARHDIVAEARRWLGTRFQHQAGTCGVATDCVGLVVGVAYALGLADARPESRAVAYNGYGKSPDPRLLLRACEEYLEPADAPELGGVLLMRFGQWPQHFAIVSSSCPLRIIHAYAQARRVVENSCDALWMSRIVRAFRFQGVDCG